MKRFLISALAIASIVACSKDEVVDQQNTGVAIAFEQAFVENATRAAEDPSTTTATIKTFDVWAFMDEMGGDVFNAETVTKNGNAWTYSNTQYWLPEHTYYFAALTPAPQYDSNVELAVANTTETLKKGLGTVTFTNVDGTTDLLYDAKEVSTDNYTIGGDMDKVAFTFNHLLSKVKFSFTNGFKNTNNTIVVKSIHMTAPKTASIDLAVDNWWDNDDWKDYDGTVNLSFGNMNNAKKLAIGASAESNVERLTIPAPATQEYTVTFDVELYTGSVLAYSGSKTVKIEGVALEMGKAYDFHATLNADNLADNPIKPIEFNVTAVKDWDNVANNDLTTILNGVTVGQGETLNLVADAVVEETVLTVNGGTLDGAGHMVTVASAEPADNASIAAGHGVFPLIKITDGAIVKNLDIDGKNAQATNPKDANDPYGIRGIYINSAGTYTIENVNIYNVTYPIHVNTKQDVVLNVFDSVLEGWLSYGTSTTATFTNVTFKKNLTNGYGNFRPYGETVLTNCNFVDVTIDLSKLAENIKFVNCFINGVALTMADLTIPAGKESLVTVE